MNYTVQMGASSEVIKADSILFEDGFVKFYCSGSKNLMAAYPFTTVTGIKQIEDQDGKSTS